MPFLSIIFSDRCYFLSKMSQCCARRGHPFLLILKTRQMVHRHTSRRQGSQDQWDEFGESGIPSARPASGSTCPKGGEHAERVLGAHWALEHDFSHCRIFLTLRNRQGVDSCVCMCVCSLGDRRHYHPRVFVLSSRGQCMLWP